MAVLLRHDWGDAGEKNGREYAEINNIIGFH
jgi:hypothetical protein